jgi:diguanylate cyclase (GGDEF)-like protein
MRVWRGLHEVQSGDDPDSFRVAASWLAGIQIGAGIVSVLTITIGLGGQPSFKSYWFLSFGILALGLFTVLFRRLLGGLWLNALLFVSTFGISYGVYLSRRTDPAILVIVFYSWVLLYAFSFLTRPAAIGQAIAVAAGFGVAVSFGERFTAPLGDWIFITGTVVVTALMVLRLVMKLSALSYTDQLTGLKNRRYFDEHIAQTLAGDRYASGRYGLAIIDLDRFKEINDTHGHLKGDEVLCTLAQLWTPVIRKGDVLARWGGDEFLLFMRDCSEEELRGAVTRLFELARPHLSLSAGCGLLRETEDYIDLIVRCDAALYQAKGRSDLDSVEDAVVLGQ